MRRTLLLDRATSSLCAQTHPHPPPPLTFISNPNALVSPATKFKLRFFSSDSDSSDPKPEPSPDPNPEAPPVPKPEDSPHTNHGYHPSVKFKFPPGLTLAERYKIAYNKEVEDVSTEDLKVMIANYIGGDDEALNSITDAIMRRLFVGTHEESDAELNEELRNLPLNVTREEIDADFEERHETDEEIDNLCHPIRHAQRTWAEKNKHFNMDFNELNELLNKESEDECQNFIDDVVDCEKLVPDDVKQKAVAKFKELGDMVERGELNEEAALELYKEFRDKLAMELAEEEEKNGGPPKQDPNEPPGEGPILRWQTRVVFSPGGEQWHPRNRKVKLAVTVKDLKLSKYQFRRLIELAGKRYHVGKGELMITSERFEHREENRKDCLRTLLSLIEEAQKANQLVDEARTSYLKESLRADPAFMARLRAKTLRLQGSNTVPPEQ